jgi:Ca2+-binding RTX toxin-like protein
MTMAVTASFFSSLLSVLGDTLNNSITLSRNAAGQLLINGGAVAIVGGQPTVGDTALIQVFGQAGDDTITLDEANGALPAAQLFGGAGNDVLTGGSGNDQLFGQDGNDTLLGKGGDDRLFGGAGNDVLTGGAGNDQVFGEAGNDLMIWNPGDGSDIFEGGDGNDTAEVNGGNGAETFTITADGGRVRFDRVSPGPFSIDIGTTENLVLNANGGDDVITAGHGLAGLINLTLDGGAGNDTITGGDGNDLLIGGDGADQLFGGNGDDTLNGGDGDDLLNGGNGDDTVVGGKGTDTAFLGNGNDTFIWNPGDGNDVVEGGRGFDTLDFRGANISETIVISANDSRAMFTRAAGNIDLNGVERIQFEAQGQHSDNITINDLTGTDVKQVAIDLGGGVAGGGDGQADTVSINATNAHAITVADNNGVVTVSGLASTVTISNFEANIDHLVINNQNVTVTNGQSINVAAVNSHNTADTSTASDGSHASSAALLSQFMASSFVEAGDGHGATPVTDQPANQPPLLAQPHA